MRLGLLKIPRLIQHFLSYPNLTYHSNLGDPNDGDLSLGGPNLGDLSLGDVTKVILA